MPVTETDICNRAIDRLGAAHLTSLDDQTENAGRFKRSYPITRDAVIRAYPWNCCTRRVALAAVGAAPVSGYARQFNLPADPYCLRVISIDGEARFGLRYRVEGRAILTDEPAPLDLVFLGRVDPPEFDALLIDVIAGRLAADLAYAITGSARLAEEARAAYRSILIEGRLTDAQEGTAEDLIGSTWLESRF